MPSLASPARRHGWHPALARLAQYGGKAIGLKIADGALLGVAAGLGDRLGALVVGPELMADCGDAIAGLRRGGVQIIVEITDWSAAVAARCECADALWLKGHEAGGWVGEQTSFILLQKIAGRTALPFHVRGGINERSAAAVMAGGAAGVVLDDQMLLLRDSSLAASLAPKLKRFTGIETILLEQYGAGPSLRIWPVPGRREARALAATARAAGGRISAADAAAIGWGDGAAIPPMGQDGTVATAWAERYGSVAAVLRAIDAAVATLPAKAAGLALCGVDTPFAKSHGTRYPIVQGPMTHVRRPRRLHRGRRGIRCAAPTGAPIAAAAGRAASSSFSTPGPARAAISPGSTSVRRTSDTSPRSGIYAACPIRTLADVVHAASGSPPMILSSVSGKSRTRTPHAL